MTPVPAFDKTMIYFLVDNLVHFLTMVIDSAFGDRNCDVLAAVEALESGNRAGSIWWTFLETLGLNTGQSRPDLITFPRRRRWAGRPGPRR